MAKANSNGSKAAPLTVGPTDIKQLRLTPELAVGIATSTGDQPKDPHDVLKRNVGHALAETAHIQATLADLQGAAASDAIKPFTLHTCVEVLSARCSQLLDEGLIAIGNEPLYRELHGHRTAAMENSREPQDSRDCTYEKNQPAKRALDIAKQASTASLDVDGVQDACRNIGAHLSDAQALCHLLLDVGCEDEKDAALANAVAHCLATALATAEGVEQMCIDARPRPQTNGEREAA